MSEVSLLVTIESFVILPFPPCLPLLCLLVFAFLGAGSMLESHLRAWFLDLSPLDHMQIFASHIDVPSPCNFGNFKCFQLKMTLKLTTILIFLLLVMLIAIVSYDSSREWILTWILCSLVKFLLTNFSLQIIVDIILRYCFMVLFKYIL